MEKFTNEKNKSLTVFKNEIQNILQHIQNFDKKQRTKAMAYLKGNFFEKMGNNSKLRKSRKRKTKKVKREVDFFKCNACNFCVISRIKMMKHLQKHEGFPASCIRCKKTFSNILLMDFHQKFCGKTKRSIGEKYKCSECPMEFSSKMNLKRHIDGHKKNNCRICSKKITSEKLLRKHMFLKHSIKLDRGLHKCDKCSKSFIRKQSLYYHKHQHFKDKQVCLECGDIFDNLEAIIKHKEMHELKKQFKCFVCEQKFATSHQYSLHLKRHNFYKCYTCDKSFASKVQMLVHKSNGHRVEATQGISCSNCSRNIDNLRFNSGDKVQYCQQCDNQLTRNNKHCKARKLESMEKKPFQFSCKTCKSSFANKYLLRKHRNNEHKNVEELRCSHCKYKTRNVNNMKRHCLSHFSAQHSFICDQCGKKFTSSSSLKDHLSYAHLKDKQYLCNICDKVFHRRSALVRHQGSHSDVRPYLCKSCDQSYKRIAHLRRHEKNVHGNLPRLRKLKVDSDGDYVPVETEKDNVGKGRIEVEEDGSIIGILEPVNLVKLPDVTNQFIAIPSYQMNNQCVLIDQIYNSTINSVNLDGLGLQIHSTSM